MSKFNQFYKDVLLAATKNSTCTRLQVAAIIVKDGRILNSGWNGSMPGQDHCCDKFHGADTSTPEFYKEHGEWSVYNEGHAEVSAIATAARQGIATDNCEMAITHTPCLPCAKAIIMAGIKKVYYLNVYDRDPAGLQRLLDSNIECVQL